MYLYSAKLCNKYFLSADKAGLCLYNMLQFIFKEIIMHVMTSKIVSAWVMHGNCLSSLIHYKF